ncbi:unnamed protein product [Citrullus colocynthis]|uniref:Uncharacterized protein n=1 Tax=Citrullus colocynthis TaxID=252529 RepID=A0ABP0XYX8_9ROSI
MLGSWLDYFPQAVIKKEVGKVERKVLGQEGSSHFGKKIKKIKIKKVKIETVVENRNLGYQLGRLDLKCVLKKRKTATNKHVQSSSLLFSSLLPAAFRAFFPFLFSPSADPITILLQSCRLSNSQHLA